MKTSQILVQKFGGTSVSTPERRLCVIDHVRRARDNGYKVAIVVSAMGRRGDPYATDTLLDLLRSSGEPLHKRDYDMIFACGEILSATLMAHILKQQGIPAVGLTGAQAGVYTNANHSEAEIVEINTSRIHKHLDAGEVPVVAGCQGVIRDRSDFTTLGRGGSDTSGVALGVALNAHKVDIFTDVDGVANADPRVIPGAKFLDHIHYDSMLEMARYGANVIHPRAVHTGKDGGIRIEVRSTFTTHPGTIINFDRDEDPEVGIATMGPLESMVLEKNVLGLEERADWEKRRLIMSLVDKDRGALVLSVSAEKSQELRFVQKELGEPKTHTAIKHCWVSLIGETDTAKGLMGNELLKHHGIEVFYQEFTDRRKTYIIPSKYESQAVKLLYDAYFNR